MTNTERISADIWQVSQMRSQRTVERGQQFIHHVDCFASRSKTYKAWVDKVEARRQFRADGNRVFVQLQEIDPSHQSLARFLDLWAQPQLHVNHVSQLAG